MPDDLDDAPEVDYSVLSGKVSALKRRTGNDECRLECETKRRPILTGQHRYILRTLHSVFDRLVLIQAWGFDEEIRLEDDPALSARTYNPLKPSP